MKRPLPSSVTTVCVLCMILGGLGMASGCFGVAGLAMQSQLQSLAAGAQSNNPAEALQLQMQSELNEVQAKWFIFLLPLTLLALAVSGGLFVGGLMARTHSEMGRAVLYYSCLVAIPAEILTALLGAAVQMETLPIVEDYMPRIVSTAGQGQTPQAVIDGATMGAKIGVYVGIAVGLGWLLAKLVLYIMGVSALSKEEVIDIYRNPEMPEPEMKVDPRIF